MTKALSFLLFTSMKNLMVMRFRRLKQPKYLVGAIVGGLYFISFFGSRLFYLTGGGRSSAHNWGATPDGRIFWESVVALILFLIVLLSWVIPSDRAALVFTEAEIAFLFPAPVGRRTLIHYKLIKSQIGILVTSLLFTLLFRGSSGGQWWIRTLGWWVAFSTLNLHRLAAAFLRTMLLEKGISNWLRRILVLGAVAIAATVVVVWTARTVPPPQVDLINQVSDVENYVQHALSSGPLPYLLYPFRLVVRPYLAPDAATFLRVIGPAALLLILHYWWVMRTNVAFEEASVEASQKMAERIATMRANRGRFVGKPTKKKRAPFQLRPEGLPAVGFLWKNLISAGQAFTLRFWLFFIWIAFIVVMITAADMRTMGVSLMAGIISLTFLGVSIFVGPQLLRQDFRQDLTMADVLKTYPVPGWQVALGELLAPAVILTGAQWLLIILSVGLTGRLELPALPFALRLGIAIGLALVVPVFNLLMLVIPNAAVLLFPGWFQAGKDAPHGIEVLGQRLIFMFGQMFVIIAVLIPTAMVFAGVFLVAHFVLRLGPPPCVPIAALGSALMMGVEVWLGLKWLGRLFERFDLSAESGG